jgi:hypothetical protein
MFLHQMPSQVACGPSKRRSGKPGSKVGPAVLNPPAASYLARRLFARIDSWAALAAGTDPAYGASRAVRRKAPLPWKSFSWTRNRGSSGNPTSNRRWAI